MLDRELLRNEPDTVRAGARRKGIEAPVDEFLRVDAEWRALRKGLDERRAEMNRASKSIGTLMGQGSFSVR